MLASSVAAVIMLSAALMATPSFAERIPARATTLPIAHHSLIAPFVGDWWQEGVPHWDLGGDAVVTDKFVRLTPNQGGKFGYIFNTQPNDNRDWELRVAIIARNRRAPTADGFGVWLVSNPPTDADEATTPGPLNGMHSDFRGIGFVLDTYDNDGQRDNPSVALVMNMEGRKREWDMDRDLTTDSRLKCTFDFRTATNHPSELVVRYEGKKLSYMMINREKGLHRDCGEVQQLDFPIDTNFFLGLTATTGHIADNHDVAGVELRPLGQSLDDPHIPLEHFDHQRDKSDRSFFGKQISRNRRHSSPPHDHDLEAAQNVPPSQVPDDGHNYLEHVHNFNN